MALDETLMIPMRILGHCSSERERATAVNNAGTNTAQRMIRPNLLKMMQQINKNTLSDCLHRTPASVSVGR